LGFELFPTGALLTELIFMHFVSAHVVHDWLTKEHVSSFAQTGQPGIWVGQLTTQRRSNVRSDRA